MKSLSLLSQLPSVDPNRRVAVPRRGAVFLLLHHHSLLLVSFPPLKSAI